MRLIDADALKTRMLEYYEDSWNLHKEIMDFFDNAPTIEERKTGKWERKSFYDSTPVCPECGIEVRWDYEYCPYCGTKLEGEEHG